MAKKKGRRNNGSGSSNFNARAKAQRERARNEDYYFDHYPDDDYYYCPDCGQRHHYHHQAESEPRRDTYRSRRENEHQEFIVEHDHSRGADSCPLCNERVALFLGMIMSEDKRQMDEYLFSLNWSIYGGLVGTILLYYPSVLARDSGVHWLIRSPWIISWHCMAVCSFTSLVLKYYFVKPFIKIVYRQMLSRALPDTIELRNKLLTQFETFHVRKLCWGLVRLFILGVGLAMAGSITLVLGRFGTVLQGVWSTVKSIILVPLRFAKWVLRGVIHCLKIGIRLADRVGRATGRNATKSGTLLLAFAKLYGRTLAKFSRSLVAFVIDLTKLLLLTAVACAVAAVFVFIYALVRGKTTPDSSTETLGNAHSARESPKDGPSPKPSSTPPPAYESLDGDLPAGDPGKKNKPRRKKQKEGADAS